MLPSNAGKEVIRPLHTLVPYAVVKSRLIIVLSIDYYSILGTQSRFLTARRF